MPPEKRDIPDWAKEERLRDLNWILGNLPIFWPMASVSFEYQGRGLVYVDTTIQPNGKGHPFMYFRQELVEEHGDEDAQRMVREYEPETEFVIVLQKTQERSSTYRVRHPDFATPSH